MNHTLTIAPPAGTLLRWSEIHAAASFALEQWELVSQIQLVGGQQRSVSEDGHNVLIVASNRQAQLAQVARDAHAETKFYLRSVSGADYAEIVEADIVVPLSSVDWDGPDRTQQLQALLVHELGHYHRFT